MSYNLLKGKRGIIFGALDENSIAWKTAERVHEEGGEFVLTNAPIAMRMGQIKELGRGEAKVDFRRLKRPCMAASACSATTDDRTVSPLNHTGRSVILVS